MNWIKNASNDYSNNELNTRLKNMIRENPFFKHMFKEYGVSLDKIDNELVFETADLKNKFSEASDKRIILDRDIVKDDKIYNDNFHFVIHELAHWLTRQKEKNLYFADPEEISSFSYAMAFELLRGKSYKEIYDEFFSIMKSHFNNIENAKKLFKALLIKAISISREYS